MTPRLRPVVAVVAGLVAWLVAATIIDRLLRAVWPAYAAVEQAMAFTLPMMAARLAMGAVVSFLAGAVAALVAPGGRAALALAIVLLLFFVPTHVALWARFPFWYHASFLASLLLCTLAGARAGPRRGD